ncbi:SDR family NAD(P)-dependent oxidoreductase, partial [Acinetobacter baumannii]
DRLGLYADTLVNNAGYGLSGRFTDMDLGRITGMMQLNMTALIELTYGVLPGMRARRQGRIMNVASIAAFQPCPNFAAYGATKAFVLSFSEAL